MAKTSVVEREKKREKIQAKFAAKRKDLKGVINDRNASDDDRWEAQMKLQKLPRNASPFRQTSPLLDHWSAAWCVSKVWSCAHQVARSSDAWRCAGPGESELVRSSPI